MILDGLGNRHQRLVAGLVSVFIIDPLEVVQVEEDDGNRVIRSAGLGLNNRHAFHQRPAVSEAREKVRACLMLELPCQVLDLQQHGPRNIGNGADFIRGGRWQGQDRFVVGIALQSRCKPVKWTDKSPDRVKTQNRSDQCRAEDKTENRQGAWLEAERQKGNERNERHVDADEADKKNLRNDGRFDFIQAILEHQFGYLSIASYLGKLRAPAHSTFRWAIFWRWRCPYMSP